MPRSPAARLVFCRPASVPGFESMLAERCSRQWRTFHDTYAVWGLLDLSGGDWEWVRPGRVLRSRAGTLALMAPGQVHATRTRTPPATFRIFEFDHALVAEAAASQGMSAPTPRLRTAASDDPALIRAFGRLHTCLTDPASAKSDLPSLVAACLRLLLERCTESRAPAETRSAAQVAVRRVRDLILENCARDMSLGDLAAMAGLDRFQLLRAFEREHCVPPHAFQILVRVTRARRLLAAGVPIAKVAAQTGFADQSHFGRHFKHVVGVSPGRYAREIIVAAGPPTPLHAAAAPPAISFYTGHGERATVEHEGPSAVVVRGEGDEPASGLSSGPGR